MSRITLLNTRAEPLAVRGYILTCLSSFVLSTTGVFIKWLLVDFGVPSFALAFQRVFFVTAAMGCALLWLRPALLRIERRHISAFMLYGFVGVGLHQPAWIESVRSNGVSVATVLVYIQPAIVTLVSWRLWGETLDRTKLIALALTLIGMVLVARAYELNNLRLNGLGLIAGIGTGITWSTYALLGRSMTRHYAAGTAMFYAFLFGTLPLAALSVWAHGAATWQLSPMAWGVLLALSLGPTLGGFALYTLGLSYLPASVTTIIGTLEPVFSIILAYLLFGEVLNGAQLIGAGLILWSVVMLRPR